MGELGRAIRESYRRIAEFVTDYGFGFYGAIFQQWQKIVGISSTTVSYAQNSSAAWGTDHGRVHGCKVLGHSLQVRELGRDVDENNLGSSYRCCGIVGAVSPLQVRELGRDVDEYNLGSLLGCKDFGHALQVCELGRDVDEYNRGSPIGTTYQQWQKRYHGSLLVTASDPIRWRRSEVVFAVPAPAITVQPQVVTVNVTSYASAKSFVETTESDLLFIQEPRIPADQARDFRDTLARNKLQ